MRQQVARHHVPVTRVQAYGVVVQRQWPQPMEPAQFVHLNNVLHAVAVPIQHGKVREQQNLLYEEADPRARVYIG